jgi:predicted enzyme related to lactoylglutathione lyase
MPVVEKHKPGSFCWIELATSDQSAAKSFYTSLFGWDVNDSPMGPGEFYSVFKLQGRDVAAAYTLRKEHVSQGIPPHWMLYVFVESADESANRAGELGGKVLCPAFDVFDLGRMAILQDPTGATFSIWQAKKHAGIGVAGDNGSLCWADLNTPDPDRVGKFYSDLFGWKMMKDEHDEHGYVHIMNGEEFIGGIPPANPRTAHTPPNWLAYFAVGDCDTSAAKAKQLGARFYMEPMTMENVGRFGVLADPQGAVFSIFQAMPRKPK